MLGNFDDDHRFCTACQTYVRYLQSPEHAYCVECGQKVTLFSKDDTKIFLLGTKTGPTRSELMLEAME